MTPLREIQLLPLKSLGKTVCGDLLCQATLERRQMVAHTVQGKEAGSHFTVTALLTVPPRICGVLTGSLLSEPMDTTGQNCMDDLHMWGRLPVNVTVIILITGTEGILSRIMLFPRCSHILVIRVL